MVTGVHRERERESPRPRRADRSSQGERVRDHDMVTGATEQIGNCHDMTGIHEEVTYCSPSTSSGKQKKNRSTSQPHFRSKNTPATIEADKLLLALRRIFTIISTKFPNCKSH